MIHYILVALGGSIGALARFVIGSFFQKRQKGFIPIGTLFVNLIGSLLLGIMIGRHIQGQGYSLFGIGFMGAFTTFSTFMLEASRLKRDQGIVAFYTYIIISYFGGIGLAAIGLLMVP